MQENKNRLPQDFDPDLYLHLNPDVADAGVDAAWHYLTSGESEGRIYRRDIEINTSIPEDFDPAAYLLLNPDVAEAGVDARGHYANFGRAEGRIYRRDVESDASLPDDFDPALYLRLNPDVAAAGVDPRWHYINRAKIEQRIYKTSAVPFPEMRKDALRPSLCAAERDEKAQLLPKPKVVAFFLPQYHRVKENDEWWGEGFTEWTNVKKARPNYEGHPQPHRPLDDDYYDLSDIAVQRRQAALAQSYGVDAFCYYMYWFNGRRILEKPLDMRIEDETINMDFCICWANENWTRTWDGRAQDVLLEQNHSVESDRLFILDAMKYLSDPRYLRHDGKLVLLVYRVDLMVDSRATAEIWREEVRSAGLGELHLCAVQFYGIDDPRAWGFDAAVEFPPHGWLVQDNLPDTQLHITNTEFDGHILDYTKSVDFALRKPVPDYCWHRGAFPGWDNTARRQNTPHTFAGSNAADFERWLTGILRQQMIMSPDEQMVFINAWNEWGEGAHLEPDQLNGPANLEAVKSALDTVTSEKGPLFLLQRLRSATTYPDRYKDELALLNLIRGYEQSIIRLMSL
ncbi:glycosyltransferase WbsX family protein [Methylobacterium sp. P31]